jgi:hypothetical protein
MFFRREFRPKRHFPQAPCPAWLATSGRSQVLVLETGIGAGRVTSALEWLLEGPVQPEVIVSAGFSGALQVDLRVGDLILATEVTDLGGNRWPVPWPMEVAAGAADLPLRRGRLLAVPHLVAGPADKRKLGEDHRALAADMESATVASLCSGRGIPFGCVRAVSDEVHTALSPRLVSLLSGGRVSPFRLLRAIVASPRLARDCWRLARQTRWAAQQLSKALRSLLAGP